MASPLLLVAAGAVGLYFMNQSQAKKSPDTVGPASTVTGASGKTWITRLVQRIPNTTAPSDREQDMLYVDVFAPKGSWGPHDELRVLRYMQVGSNKSTRKFITAPPETPKAIFEAAAKDFGVQPKSA